MLRSAIVLQAQVSADKLDKISHSSERQSDWNLNNNGDDIKNANKLELSFGH